jgi:uncharacterized protein DUF6438
MRQCYRLAILCALAGPISVSAQQSVGVPADTVITLERTVCFGTCPAYTVSIDAGGNVTYEGRKYVRVSGQQRARISTERVARLVETVARIGFFGLKDEYAGIQHPDGTTTFVTDLPSTIVTVTSGVRQKRVMDYLGAPIALRDFEDDIDEAANTRRWVGIDKDTVRQEP